MKKSIPSCYALALTCAGAVLTQTAQAEMLVDDWGSWVQLVGEGSLKFIDPSWEKGRIWLEGQSRWDDDWNHWYQGLLRAAVGYSLTNNLTVWAGYTYLPTQNVGRPSVQQQDVWPGIRYVLPTDAGTFTYRMLFEANFLPGNHGDVRFRPRQMFRFSHPLSFEPRLSFVLWDEVFIRVNSTPSGGQSGFDQNRAFAGFGWSFTPNVRTELGYLNQYIDNANHVNTVMHNLVMCSLFVNF
jgi:hypothetical protein